MSTIADIKPCPFCGGEAKHNRGGNSRYGRLWWRVWCDECQYGMHDMEIWNHDFTRLHEDCREMESIERWNRRAV